MSGKDNKSSLAHRAQQKYNAGKYVEAIDALQKLSEEIAPDRDLKVQHNLVLAGFVAAKYQVKEFESSLRNLLSSLTDDADARRRSGMSLSDSDGDGISHEREASFIRYNLAAALFQQKQYAAASAVLDVLMRNIEPIDEKVAMHVCFLYLDIILHSSRGCVVTERERAATLKKAQSIVAYLEKPHGFNGQLVSHNDDGGGTGDGGGTVDAQQAKKDSLDIVEFRFRLHLYKAKIWLLQNNLKTAKKEAKSALEIFQKELKARDRMEDLATMLAASSVTSGGDKTSTAIGHPSLAVQKSTGLFLKANLEYLRMNYKKCIKLLASCVPQAVDESIFLNNMGCIHFQMGQRKAAQSYFARALEASSKPRKTPHEAEVISTSSQSEIMYNNGVHLLLQGDYALAFRCFHASSRLFFNRPKLWLRMGECCTAAFAQQAKLAAVAGNKSGLIQGVIGAGSHRRVLLSTAPSSTGAEDIELPEKYAKAGANNSNGAASSSASSSSPDGTPKMNLPFAAKCFKNVVLLCNQLMESKANGIAENAHDNSEASVEALDLLRQKALVNLSYVYLSMHEPQLAITSAKELLMLPTCSKANRFLARSYGAEALCMLSRAQEATQVLQAERELMQMAEQYAEEAKIPVNNARAAVYVNNATSLILQGKVTEAEVSVSRAVGESATCRESLELLVYFYLKKGDTKKALRVLKEAQVA